MKEVKLVFEITVPFENFNNKRRNLRMKNGIIRWLKEAIVNLSYVPVYIRENGETIEYCSKKIKVKMISCDMEKN